MPASSGCSDFDELPQSLARAHRAHFRNRVADVGTVEARDEALGVLEPQLGDDLLAGALVRGGREGNARDTGEPLGKHLELTILRTEVVPPLRDAVRLVNCEEGDVGSRKKRQRTLLQ